MSTVWEEEELRENIGQLLIVGFDGHLPNEDIRTLIIKHKVGAVILFSRNVSDSAQLSSLTASLQELSKASKYPLFISIDQENGLVTRIKAPTAVQMPGSMALGATGDASTALKVASATAQVLKSFGINMNYGPIADVNSEPNNPVIGVRSPSDDPETVGRFMSAQIKGLQEGGIVPCVKHFPGHGDTAVDSHYGLPVISKSKSELDACELIPFRRAVAEGVASVMTAHISMPGIGSNLPASLSPDAIKILREEMKYDGVIVSDCLEMDGVRATYGTEKGAVMAIKAGTDCVMVCHTMSAQVGAIEELVQAVKSGELSQDAIRASVDRVHNLKSQYLSRSSAPASVDTKAQETLASKIYAQSTTLVRSEPAALPVSREASARIVFLSPGKTLLGGGAVKSGEEKTREPYTPATYIDLLRLQNPSIIEIRFDESIALSTDSEKSIAEADAMIMVTRNASLSLNQKDLGMALGKKLGKKLIVIATCDPYDFLKETEEVKNYIAIYEPTIPAFKSAVDVIFGHAKAVGTLPVGSNSSKQASKTTIQRFENSPDAVDHIWKLWNIVFSNWRIERQRLAKILLETSGKHFVHDHGFCLSFIGGGLAKIAILGVLPDYRGKGLGTSFIKRAVHALKPTRFPISIGSSFPRLWPGVPIDFSAEAKEFFAHRGFRKSKAPTCRDLFRDIRGKVAPPAVLERVAKLPLTYSPLTPELYEECITKQRANFSHNEAWVKAYERLAAANEHEEIMVAFDDTGTQVGWTLMCSPSSLVCQEFAFLPLMPSKGKTGLIACVGVDQIARKKGVGLALLVKAMESMRERGIEGVCIDWVVIRGFYETLGYEVFWEYENYEW